jgi:hypothetical protein
MLYISVWLIILFVPITLFILKEPTVIKKYNGIHYFVKWFILFHSYNIRSYKKQYSEKNKKQKQNKQ